MKTPILLFASLWSTAVLGQNLDTLYLDSLSRLIYTKTNAGSIRIVNTYDSVNDQYWVTDFDTNGRKLFEGQRRFLNSVLATGKFKYFFENGAIKLEGNAQNILTPEFTLVENLWYPNGSKYGSLMIHQGVQKLITHYDSLGEMDVVNGNGYCHCIDFGEKIISEGKIVDGVREGEWLIKDFKGVIKAKELYVNGALLEGIESTSDSVRYVDESIYYNSIVGKKIKRAIKRHIENSVKKNFKQRREIFYLLRVRGNRVTDIELLLDHFLFENKVDPVVPIGSSLFVKISGRKNEMTAVSKCKVKL